MKPIFRSLFLPPHIRSHFAYTIVRVNRAIECWLAVAHSSDANGRFAIMLHHTSIIDSIFRHSQMPIEGELRIPLDFDYTILLALDTLFILMNTARFIAVAFRYLCDFFGEFARIEKSTEYI